MMGHDKGRVAHKRLAAWCGWAFGHWLSCHVGKRSSDGWVSEAAWWTCERAMEAQPQAGSEERCLGHVVHRTFVARHFSHGLYKAMGAYFESLL